MSDSDEYFATSEIELDVSIASVRFRVIEEATSARLEEWRAFASGKIDCIEYCCVGGQSGYDIMVGGDSAKVIYTDFSDIDFYIEATVPASLLRDQIRRQLPSQTEN